MYACVILLKKIASVMPTLSFLFSQFPVSDAPGVCTMHGMTRIYMYNCIYIYIYISSNVLFHIYIYTLNNNYLGHIHTIIIVVLS